MLVLIADLCSRYPLLTVLKDLYMCEVRSPCSLRIFDPWFLAVTASALAFMDIRRFRRVIIVVPCISVKEMSISGPYKFLQACYLAALRSFVPLVNERVAEWS